MCVRYVSVVTFVFECQCLRASVSVSACVCMYVNMCITVYACAYVSLSPSLTLPARVCVCVKEYFSECSQLTFGNPLCRPFSPSYKTGELYPQIFNVHD